MCYQCFAGDDFEQFPALEKLALVDCLPACDSYSLTLKSVALSGWRLISDNTSFHLSMDLEQLPKLESLSLSTTDRFVSSSSWHTFSANHCRQPQQHILQLYVYTIHVLPDMTFFSFFLLAKSYEKSCYQIHKSLVVVAQCLCKQVCMPRNSGVLLNRGVAETLKLPELAAFKAEAAWSICVLLPNTSILSSAVSFFTVHETKHAYNGMLRSSIQGPCSSLTLPGSVLQVVNHVFGQIVRMPRLKLLEITYFDYGGCILLGSHSRRARKTFEVQSHLDFLDQTVTAMYKWPRRMHWDVVEKMQSSKAGYACSFVRLNRYRRKPFHAYDPPGHVLASFHDSAFSVYLSPPNYVFLCVLGVTKDSLYWNRQQVCRVNCQAACFHEVGIAR